MPAAACEALAGDESCGGLVAAYRVGAASDRPAGPDAVAARGDLVLDNGIVRAVIDAVDHNQHLALSGGTLVDLAPAGGPDGINQIMQAVGILPRDQAEYTSVELAEVTPLSASVVARGHLYQDARLPIVTRYELRACEQGVRMRTEIYNGSRIPQTFYLTDGYFWGDRGPTPFAPAEATGFAHPTLDLLKIAEAFRTYPFMSAQTHMSKDDVSYATVACDRKALSGFNTLTLSAAGKPRQVVMPGDGLAFERIVFAARGAGSSRAQTLAMQAREQLFGEHSVEVKGTARFTSAKLPQGTGRDLSLVFTATDGTPWAEAVPDEDGHYSVRLPPARTFEVQAHSFGRPVLAPQHLEVGNEDVTFDLNDLPEPATVVVTVRDPSGGDLDAEVILRPTGASNEESVGGQRYGQFTQCAPYLGPPHGAYPACNRVFVSAGRAVFQTPPGEYWVYATRGPSFTLARERIAIAAGAQAQVALVLRALPDVFPTDALHADFHVHGGRSFDTQIPDFDRVASFLTSGVQVVAATDHDVVGSYETELLRLGASDRLFVISGVELTQLVLFYKRDGGTVPRTLGHFNFWPLAFDPLMPRNGALWDETKHPGALYDEMTPLIGPHGVRQLNHPYAESKLGRDEGTARALGYDVRKPIREAGTDPAGYWLLQPQGGHRNIDHDVQEVMNGSGHLNFLEYRALWYSFLRQGYLRAGTANSDSHSVTLEQVGYPRNIVLTPNSFPAVDMASLNTAVREGRMVGSNGPYIEASITDMQGVSHGPSIKPIQPQAGAAFHVVVRAAPWIPVQELRVIVNGDVVDRIAIAPPSNSDPFGTAGVVRYVNDFPLGNWLKDDGFVVFEAGLPLIDTAFDEDLGIAKVEEGHQLYDRASENDPRYHVDTVSPGTWPTAFTNPFVIDLGGDGWRAPGL